MCQENVAECQDTHSPRDYFAQPMTLEALERRILELARIHAARLDEDIKAELEKSRKQVAAMKDRLH
jgi:hypothetical protein